jgi:small GTP-binding protein
MGNCNCLSSSNSYKNAETTVDQIIPETKTLKAQNVQNSIQEKRGASIPNQCFVKQSSIAAKSENFIKNSSFVAPEIVSIRECNTQRFKDRNDIKIVVLGDSYSGKSSFVIRYVTGKFESYYVVSVCNEYYQKKGVNFNGIKYDLEFTIRAGKSEYQEDITKTCEEVDIFLMFYDVSSKQSFDNLKTTYGEIRNHMFNFKDSISNVIFIGNKSDIKEKKVTVENVKEYLQNDKVSVFEISVKNNTNITKVFNKILEVFDKAAYSMIEK